MYMCDVHIPAHWRSRCVRAVCYPDSIHVYVHDYVLAALCVAPVLLAVKGKLRYASFRPDCERGVNTPSTERFPVQVHEIRAQGSKHDG